MNGLELKYQVLVMNMNHRETEKIILGRILTDRRLLPVEGEFVDPRHYIIYQAAVELDRGGKDIQLDTVVQRLQSSGMLSKVGGASYLTELQQAADPPRPVEYITLDRSNPKRLLEASIPPTGFIRDFIAITEKATDTPRPFLLASSLVTLATVLSDRVCVRWEARKLKPSVWVVLIGPSGSRKGTATDLPRLLVERTDETLLLPQVASEEGFTKALAGKDGSPAAGLVTWQEFSRMLRKWSSKSSWEISQEFLIDVYDGKSFKKKLVSQEFAIHEPCVCVLAGTTPGMFAKYFGLEDLEGGFFGRLYIIWVPKRERYLPIPEPIREDGELNRLTEFLGHLRHDENFQGELDYGGIRDDFIAWAKEKQAHADPLIPAFTSRIETHCIKLAMLYEASKPKGERSGELSGDSLGYAMAMVEYLMATMRDLVSVEFVSEEEQKVQKILETIEQSGRDGIKRSEVMQRHRLSASDMDRIDKTLLHRELTRKKPGSKGEKGGRPSVRYVAERFL